MERYRNEMKSKGCGEDRALTWACGVVSYKMSTALLIGVWRQ